MMKNEIASSKSKNDSKSKSIRCEKMMDKFLMLDKHERIPIDVTLHLLRCKKCRSQVRYLTKAEKIASSTLKTSASRIKPVSMKKWIVCGILMMILMMSYTFSAAKFVNETANAFFYILFGFVVTAYCAIFIAANLDFFVKKIEKSISSKDSQDLSAFRS